MKKVLLISVSALALSAGAAFAQSPVITGTPPTNGAFYYMPTTAAPALTSTNIPLGNTSLI